ncbi:hypothetical protein HYH03_002569 [Edaphochlamys debaryana]|uniref:Uncharacterized protein n=1 Tax=Edaphochlamys debaryana TaxID=47281 RepID=A0A836C497_9CHLO|nr:hypothetical protein HYH03_002569 [Edaphochlamys debaryana]|eukprot:KAG2499630.1 hypothetical protein HYH03_002569 [Edaphochlamys debaryana]
MLLQKKLSRPSGIVSSTPTRRVPLVRCSAAAEAPSAAPAERASESSRPPSRTAGPRRFASRGPPRDADGEASSARPGRFQGNQLPAIAFLEDDEGSSARRATALFKQHLCNGRSVLARALGRQGCAGALRFLVALREEADKHTPRMDVRFRLLEGEEVRPFGTPLLFFAEPVRARVEPPATDTVLLVSKNSVPERLRDALTRALSDNLKKEDGSFVRVDMVGASAMYRGVQALAEARETMGKAGGALWIVPEVVTEPLRAAAAQTATVASADGGAAGATEDESSVAPAVVQVMRLWVGRNPRPQAETPAGAKAPEAQAAPAAGPAEAATPAAVSTAPEVGEGKIVVSAAEWEALKGALSSMVEQQRNLTSLLEAQQAMAAKNGAGVATPSA